MLARTEVAVADVFNREYQSHRIGADWKDVMRDVARAVAQAIHPESEADRVAFIDAANWSGLFTDA